MRIEPCEDSIHVSGEYEYMGARGEKWFTVFYEQSEITFPIIASGRGNEKRKEEILKPKYTYELDNGIINFQYGTERGSFKYSKGFEYIHNLLLAPNQDIKATRLITGLNAKENSLEIDCSDEQLSEFIDNQPLLDRQAINENLKRIKELKEANDEFGRTEERDREIYQIEDYLSQSISNSGKSRSFTQEDARARSSVGKAITRALDQIKNSKMPLFYDHLKSSIQKGYDCCYSPQEPINWKSK